jgi:uncharacterized membrane protein YgcG
MRIGRLFRHATTLRWHLGRAFDAEARAAIQKAVTDSESLHRGEIRFAVEARLDTASLWAGETARERALELFATLGVWDTAENSGILVYVLLADRRVEIVADRGYRGDVTDEQWRAVCAEVEAAFGAGHYREGAVKGVMGCARHAVDLFPSDGADPNELPDAVVFL